jgi:hypothetical protein
VCRELLLSAGQPWEHTALLIEARKVQDTDTYSLFSVVTTSQGRLSLSTLPAVLDKVHAPGSEDLVDEIRAIDCSSGDVELEEVLLGGQWVVASC